MTISFSQQATLTCPKCRISYLVEIWLIIAADERPDLVERIRAGTLHTITCPNDHQGVVDAPLLLYRPRSTPAILFSPAQQTTRDQDQQHADGLVPILRERLGDAWHGEWLAQGISGLQREILPIALADDPEEALGNLQVQLQRTLDELRERNPEEFARREVEVRQTLEVARTVTSSSPTMPPVFISWLTEAEQLEQRFLQIGDRSALDTAVQVWNNILGHAEFSAARLNFRLAALNNAGVIFLRRYWSSGRIADLDRALELWMEAVRITPPSSPDLPSRLSNLGNGLRDRYVRTGQLEDLERALTVYQQAVATTVPDSPNLPGYLNNLGNGLRDQYLRTSRLEDLDQAISAFQQAVAATPPDSPDLPRHLNNLGNGLRDRYDRTGRLEDLEQVLTVYHRAVATTPPNSPDLSSILNNLGTGLRDQYERTGRQEDLEQALRIFQQAVQITPLDSPDLPSRLNNLGTGLRDQYERTGRQEDLEQALRIFQQAVQITPLDSPNLPVYLTNLGIALRARYACTGRLEDLEQACSVLQQAVTTSLTDSPYLPSRLNNLGIGLRARYARTGRLEDLDQALTVLQQAVATTPGESLDLPGYLTNLGIGLRARYARTKRPEDLEQALTILRQAVETTPPDSPYLPSRLNNLGIGLRDWYVRIGQLEVLEQTCSILHQAVQITPPDSPDLPVFLNNLGAGLRDRYVRSRNLVDLKQAQASFAVACDRGKLLAPEVALTASQSWGRWASERGSWDEAVRAFDTALEVVEQLHRTQLRRGDQETWLSVARGLHTRASYALVRTGAHAIQRAVEVAENGRARGLGETLTRDRSDLSEIERSHPEIYGRYYAAAARIHQFEQTVREEQHEAQQSSPGIHSQDLITLITAARDHLDAAIDEIRALPGYGNFLLSPTYAEIAATARPGTPLVYLIVTPQGSLALIVFFGTDKPVALLIDGFNEQDLDQLLIEREGDEMAGGYLPAQLLSSGQLDSELHKSLPRMGASLLAPLAARLRTMGGHGVVLIPTGLLSLLPLHAATYTVDGKTGCLLDEFDVTYAPSARVLATAQRELRKRAKGRLCLAGVGNPTEDLRFAAPELEGICDLLPANAAKPFYGRHATRAAIWAALPTSTIAHFSCHGSFATDPLDSALHLAIGDQITLRELVTGDTSALADLRMVVLSACQTAIADFRRVPDESIGLPGGFLQAGVPAVVGSLWSINDLSTALLMHRFYELHLHGDAKTHLEPQPPVRALRLAQLWLRDLTYQAMFDYFDWHRRLTVTHKETIAIRMGSSMVLEGREIAEEGLADDPHAHPYADPVYWAAFTFNGAMEG